MRFMPRTGRVDQGITYLFSTASTLGRYGGDTKLSLLAQMKDSKWGGSWIIDGEYIYCVGGIMYYSPNRVVSRNLFKLNAKNPSSGWTITSSSRKFSLSTPFVALIDRKVEST